MKMICNRMWKQMSVSVCPLGGALRLLQGSGPADGVCDVALGDEAILRPTMSAQVLLPAKRAHHGHAERP